MDADLPLIQSLQAGDDRALNELMARHRDGLFHFVCRYLQNDAAAQDVVQETFVRCYFKAQKFKPQASVKTWLYAIAVNLARDHLRKTGRATSVSIDSPRDTDAPFQGDIKDPAISPDEQTSRSDKFSELQRAIDKLPLKLREPLVLYALEEKSQQEVAEILGTTAKTVELRVYHAKAKLRKLLDHVLDRAASGGN